MISRLAAKRKNRANAAALLEATEFSWRIVGDMNFASAPLLLSQGRNLLEFGGDLLIDMSGVDHADSAGLALLLEWIDLSRSSKGNIRFQNIPEALMNIARVSNVYDLLSSEG